MYFISRNKPYFSNLLTLVARGHPSKPTLFTLFFYEGLYVQRAFKRVAPSVRVYICPFLNIRSRTVSTHAIRSLGYSGLSPLGI